MSATLGNDMPFGNFRRKTYTNYSKTVFTFNPTRAEVHTLYAYNQRPSTGTAPCALKAAPASEPTHRPPIHLPNPNPTPLLFLYFILFISYIFVFYFCSLEVLLKFGLLVYCTSLELFYIHVEHSTLSSHWVSISP